MCKLSDWYLSYQQMSGVKRRVAKGVVSGHYRLSDGMSIHTSAIRSIEMDGDTALIHTKNSLYKCDMKDARYDKFKYTDMIEGFEEYRERFENGSEIPPQIDEGEVLIRLSNNREYYYDSVRIKEKERDEIIDSPDVHVGMFQDSVLSRFEDYEDYENCRFFDYFPYKGRHVEFYSWDDDGLNVYIENTGDAEMYVTVKGNVYCINPGEKKLIVEENMEEKTGMLSSEDLYSVYDNKHKLDLFQCLGLLSMGAAVKFDDEGNCSLDMSFVQKDAGDCSFFQMIGTESGDQKVFVEKETVDKIRQVLIVVEELYQVKYRLHARNAYYRVRGNDLTEEQLAMVYDDESLPMYHMFHRDGTLGCTGSLDDSTNIMQLVIELLEAQLKCPFLDYTMAITWWDEMHPAARECADPEQAAKYEGKEYDDDFYTNIETGICVRENKIEILDRFQAKERYKIYADLYEKEDRNIYLNQKTSKL